MKKLMFAFLPLFLLVSQANADFVCMKSLVDPEVFKTYLPSGKTLQDLETMINDITNLITLLKVHYPGITLDYMKTFISTLNSKYPKAKDWTASKDACSRDTTTGVCYCANTSVSDKS